MIGLLGAHRVGKTTLARGLSKAMHYNGHALTVLETNLGGVFEEFQLDPAAQYPFYVQMKIQECLLNHLEEKYIAAPTWFVADRTPIDVLAYTMAAVDRRTLDDERLEEAIAQHYVRAFKLTNRYFQTVALVQPGIPVVDASGKAPPSQGYIEHLNAIMRGLLFDVAVEFSAIILPSDCLNLAKRVKTLGDAVKTIIVSSETLPGEEATFH